MHRACTGVLSYAYIKHTGSMKVIGLYYSSQNLSYRICTVNPPLGRENMEYAALS